MSKKKKKGSGGSNKPQKPTTYIKQAARKLPVGECLALPDWGFSGMTHIVVPRQKANGGAVVGHYMLDTFCLGLKDTQFAILKNEMEYEEHIALLTAHQDFEPIEPALAFNLIYGAIEFAEDHGFEPHKDFEITEYILPDVEEIEYIDLEFGKDGKPFFISGPYDNVEKIMGILKKNHKEGEFGFAAHIEPDLLDNIVPETIDDFFPKEKVTDKMASLDEPNQFVFQTFLDIAKIFLDDCLGDVDLLSDMIDDESYFEDVLIRAVGKVNKKDLVDDFNPEELEALLFRNANFVLETLSEYGNLEVLYDKDFMPIPMPLSHEDSEGLSAEELLEYEERMMKSFTEDEKMEMFFTSVFLGMIHDDAEKGELIPTETNSVDVYYKYCVEKFIDLVPDFDKSMMEDEEDFLRDYFDSALESYREDLEE